MAEKPKPVTPLYCSFCGKSQYEVRKLIAGPTVFICDECVALCGEIIADENAMARLRREGRTIVSADDAKRLAWMRTWTVSAPAQQTGAQP